MGHHRMRLVGVLVVVFAMFALLARSALADQGVVVAQSGSALTVTVYTEAANIHFGYNTTACPGEKPCYTITAGQGMVGIPVSGSCNVQPGNAYTPSAVQCPAQSIGAITFIFRNGGSWAAYQGGGGQHSGEPCAPAAATIRTGGQMTSVTSWDGCHETVICITGGFSGVEADASDTIRGNCTSVVRH